MATHRVSKHRAYKRSKAWALPAVGAAAAVIGQPLLAGSTASAGLAQPKTATVVPVAQEQRLALGTTTTDLLDSAVMAPAAPASTSMPTADDQARYVEGLLRQAPQQESSTRATSTSTSTSTSSAASRSTSRSAPSEEPAPRSFPVLEDGADLSDYQAQILYVQKKLGVMKSGATLATEGAGVYGERTQAAVRRFQRASGLTPDGSVGELTWKKISAIGGTWDDPGPGSDSGSGTSNPPTVTIPTGTRAKVSLALSIATDIADSAKADGVRYVWGGNGPTGFDCSGFVKYTLAKAGYDLKPRTASDIYDVVQHISRSEVRPGDLFFKRDSSGYIYHIGFVGKDGMWVEARSTAKGVGVFDPWREDKVFYGRVQ